MLSQQPSTPVFKPHELPSPVLENVDEIEEGELLPVDTPTTAGEDVKARGISTPQPYRERKSTKADRRSLQLSRRHVEESQVITRGEKGRETK